MWEDRPGPGALPHRDPTAPASNLHTYPAGVHLFQPLICPKVAVRNVRSTGRLRRLAACAAIAATCAVASGCGSSQPAPLQARELAEAQTFPFFAVYWVGTRFESYPVVAVDGRKSYSAGGGDGVYYGNCLPGKSSALNGNGCVLPLQVTTELYELHDNVALGNPHRNLLLRGVPAIVFDEGHSIQLYSGRLEINVYSDDLADALHAVKLLRPVNAPGSAQAPLPPPVFCPTLSGPQPQALQHAMQHLPHDACQRAAADIRTDKALFGKP